jgi:hypothetical protein
MERMLGMPPKLAELLPGEDIQPSFQSYRDVKTPISLLMLWTMHQTKPNFVVLFLSSIYY